MKPKVFAAALIWVAVMFLPASCKKDDSVLFGQTEFADIRNGALVNDEGQIFHITENLSAEALPNEGRVVALIDILRRTKGKSNEWDVRLRQFDIPLVKDAVDVSELEADDPIYIHSCWDSGGYININFAISYALKMVEDKWEQTGTKHLINLFYKSDGDTLRLCLNHNGYGEVFGETGNPQMQDSPDWSFVTGSGFLCVPVASLPLSAPVTPVVLTWKWYDYDSSDSAYLPTSSTNRVVFEIKNRLRGL